MTVKNKFNTNDSGDLVGSIPFFANDGLNNKLVAEIRCYVDAAVVPASGNVASRFEFWTNTSGGTLTKAATLDSSQAFTPAAGVVRTGRAIFENVPIGSVAYSSLGTNTSASANSVFISEVSIDRNIVLTGIGVLNGAQAAGNSIYALYDSAGTLLAQTASTANAGTNAFQKIAFTATYSAVPGRYWIAAMSNNDSHTYRTLAASTFVNCYTDLQAQGGFTMPATITVPTSFAATKGPVSYVYV